MSITVSMGLPSRDSLDDCIRSAFPEEARRDVVVRERTLIATVTSMSEFCDVLIRLQELYALDSIRWVNAGK